ncbi:hypothetical protein JCM3766R1_004884 [Sporobolomyces carnicolor]
MRDDKNDHAVFPVEIVNQIFRSLVLDSTALARCCLLSREYLPTARKWLYAAVNASLSERKFDGFDGFRETTEYSRSTGKLIAAILHNPALARLIHKVHFLRDCVVSGIHTTGGDAVAAILTLAPTVTALEFNWDDQVDEWLEDALPKLDCSTYVNLDAHSVGRQLSTIRLDTLAIEHPVDSSAFDVARFIALSASTLQELRIHLFDLPKLALRAYPRLRRVELFLFPSPDPITNPFHAKPFQRQVEKCENLTTIAFAGSKLPPDLENCVFGTHGGLAQSGSWRFRRLRRIEFTEDVSIDALLLFLKPRGSLRLAELAVNADSVTDSKLQYLSAARKWLCHEVEVTFYDPALSDSDDSGTSGDETSDDETSDDDMEEGRLYVQRPAALIDTIRHDPALARLVRRVKFRFRCEGLQLENVDRGAVIGNAVAKILELTPMATAIDQRGLYEEGEWLPHAIPQLDSSTCTRYHDFSVYNFDEDVSAFVSKLKNLKSLTISQFEPDREIVVCQLSTTCLETISIQDYCRPSTFSIAEFVAPSTSTLRNLGIHLSEFGELDLKAYPNLRRIELFVDGGTSYEHIPFHRSKFRELRHCSNLTTIALRGPEIHEECEKFVFGNQSGGGFLDYESEGLPQLRRVEFSYGCYKTGVSIDHLLKFFRDRVDRPKLRARLPLKELAVSLRFVKGMRLQFVRMICENAGVELILLD